MSKKIGFGAALIFCLVAASTVATAATSREDFLKNAIKGDNSEIRLGRLAARNAGSSAVRDYGRTLMNDHLKARAQASHLAAKLGIRAPSGAMLKADAEYVKLRVLSGKNFDREFVGYMIEDHKQDIRDFSAMARSHYGSVGDLAQAQLPTLRKHLRMALAIQPNL